MFDKKYAVIIADSSEEIEITVPTDILRRSGATCELISVNCLTVIGSHGIKITADKLIAEVDYSAYDGVIVPGGMDGAKAIAACKQATDFIYGLYNRQKLVAAICAAPAIVLSEIPQICDRTITCYPDKDLISRIKYCRYRKSEVVSSANLITGNGPLAVFKFSMVICRHEHLPINI